MSVSDASWDNQVFSFGWNPYSTIVSQCDNIAFGWGDNFNAAPNSTGPYQLQIYSGLGRPLLVPFGFGNNQNWQATVPAGNLYMFGMTDSRGLSGGLSQLVQINRATAGCNETSFAPNTLSYDILSTGTPQCGKLFFQVKDGRPPYQLKILPEDHFPKTINFSSNILEYVIDLNSNARFFTVLSDSSGKVSTQGLFTVEPSNDATCLKAASTVTSGFPSATTYSVPQSALDGLSGSHKSKTGAIVGGVIGGVAFLILLGHAYFLFRRRQKNKRRTSDLDLSSPVDQRHHFFPDSIVRPTPWTPAPSDSPPVPRSSDVPLMAEARPKHTYHRSDSSGHGLLQTESSDTSPQLTSIGTSFPSPEPSEVAGPSGSASRVSRKRPPSTQAPTVVVTSTDQEGGTLREEDVGVAVPPPPSYRESSYNNSEG